MSTGSAEKGVLRHPFPVPDNSVSHLPDPFVPDNGATTIVKNALNPRTRNAGFTLVELMVVLAIIGMLLSIAIPAYQDYAIRGRISEGLSLASMARSVVTDNATMATPASVGGLASGLPTGPGSSCMAPGVCVYPLMTSNVENIAVDTANGRVTVAFTTRAAPSGANTLVLVPTVSGLPLQAGVPPDGPFHWLCYAAGRPGAPAAATLVGKHAPAECRG